VVGDLFVFALDWSEHRGQTSANPDVMVRMLCRSLSKNGRSILG